MYCPRSAHPNTLLSTVSFFLILSVLILHVPTVASRNVHKHLLYTKFKSPISNLLLDDHTRPEIDDLLKDWVSVQGLLDLLETNLRPTPRRQEAELKATPSELTR